MRFAKLSGVALSAITMLIVCNQAPASAQEANISLGGAYGHVALSSGFSSPYHITLPAGGEISASGLGAGCTGIISERATYSVDFTPGSQQPLYFAASAREDTTLVIHAPDGTWHCDDDSFGDRNPIVRIDAPASGRYQVWLGVVSFVTGSPDTTLQVSEGTAPPKDDGSSDYELH